MLRTPEGLRIEAGKPSTPQAARRHSFVLSELEAAESPREALLAAWRRDEENSEDLGYVHRTTQSFIKTCLSPLSKSPASRSKCGPTGLSAANADNEQVVPSDLFGKPTQEESRLLERLESQRDAGSHEKDTEACSDTCFESSPWPRRLASQGSQGCKPASCSGTVSVQPRHILAVFAVLALALFASTISDHRKSMQSVEIPEDHARGRFLSSRNSIRTVSTVTLQEHSLRKFGALERQKFRQAVAHALSIHPDDVEIKDVIAGGKPVLEDLRHGFLGRVPADLTIQYEVAMGDTANIAQHTLQLSKLMHSGEMQRILHVIAGISSKTLTGKHIIKRPGK